MQPTNYMTGPDMDRPTLDALAVTHSLFSARGLVAGLLPDYDLGEVGECRLLQHNQNDTYLVRTLGARYVLRIYQAHGMYTPRAYSDILYEAELLNHVASRGVAVSRLIARRDGTFVRELSAAEGLRQAVLFEYLPGAPLPSETWDATFARDFGRTMAELHVAADFTSLHPRFALDLDYLLRKPLRLVQPLLAHRPEDLAYIRQLATRLEARIEPLEAQSLLRGICHGDLLGKTNVNVASDGTMPFYDFECCGPGWHSYDLAVFSHTLILLKSAEEADDLFAAFLAGYGERITLGGADTEAVPVFVALRHFWLLGLRTGNWENWGEGEVNDEALDWWLAFWPGWEARLGGTR